MLEKSRIFLLSSLLKHEQVVVVQLLTPEDVVETLSITITINSLPITIYRGQALQYMYKNLTTRHLTILQINNKINKISTTLYIIKRPTQHLPHSEKYAIYFEIVTRGARTFLSFGSPTAKALFVVLK